jgi:hypothetical protein
MRRTLIVIALVASLGVLALGGWADKGAGRQTATCAVTHYTVNGSFNRLGGPTSFSVSASGSCVGTSMGVTVNLSFASVGSWSCSAGAAVGSGVITADNGLNQFVNASLANVGGEYVIEVHALNGTAAAGQFLTLPIDCDLGQTQATIGGSGALTFTA